jgi:hypothetical protein
MAVTINASTSAGLVQTADTTGQLQLQTAGTTAVTIDTSQNVGIGGTAGSTFKLDVIANSSSNALQLRAINNDTSGTSASSLVAQNGSGTVVQLQTYGTDAILNVSSNNPLAFRTNNTERMRIDSAGNVLIAKAARATITTDNDLSFDMNAASNFKCTPTALGTLTFTNITSGQSGFVLLVNTGGYAISAAATTEVSSTTLTTISTAGTYLLSYFSDGTHVFLTNSGALA